MKKTREDNTVSVVQRAISHYGIKVTGTSVIETLKSNSYYPTFRSICDAFNEWKIEHYPLKYEPEEIKELNPPYITHFKAGGGQIAFVTGYEDSSVVYYDSYGTRKKIGWDEYIQKSSGAVILMNPDEKSGEKNYKKKFQEELLNKFIVPAIIGVVALVISALFINKASSLQMSWQQYTLISTKFAGIFFSAMLLMKEYEINMPLAEKLCRINSTINCNSVLNDKAAMVFGHIGWADIGMIYFTGSFLTLLQGNSWNGFLIAASALSMPYTLFSIWYQGFRLKKWCPFCIMVQVILVAEFLIQISFLHVADFSIGLFTIMVLTFLSVGVLQALINLYIRESGKAEFNYGKLLKFKNNPDILRAVLFNQKHFEIRITCNSLIFGKLNSNLQITAFLSLHCSHCAGAFVKVAEILRSSSDAQVNIVLVGADSKIINTLHYFLKNNKEDEALSLLDQWYKSDHIARSRFQDEYCLLEAEKVTGEFDSESRNLMKNCEVTGTPTFFINGYRLPPQYEIDDVEYFSRIYSKKKY
ncbi:MAG: vitamin K epoxide reductase family protein [Methanosarcina sp.]